MNLQMHEYVDVEEKHDLQNMKDRHDRIMAHSSGIECVPLVAAGAEPFVLFAGRPAAERAPDAGVGREALFLVGLAIQNN